MKDLFLSIGLKSFILASIFVLSVIIQLYYFLWIFTRSFRKSSELNRRVRKYPPVSIIICARNEAENLRNKLPRFLEQDYPEFEVIVVNDRSDDDSEEVLNAMKLKYSNLKVSKVIHDPKLVRGKKLALTLGIKSASFSHLLLSDADCEPAGKEWIKYMVRNYDDSTEMVLGIGLYRKTRGLLNLFIRFESAYIAMQYISLTRLGSVFMGVGRNLSYKKELFFRNKGFASHLKLESGDDDLFVNEVAISPNTKIETHPGSFTYSEPVTGWKNWIRQKQRHLTTARHYRMKTKIQLVTEYLSRIFLLVSFILLLFSFEYRNYVLIVFSGLLLIKGITFKIAFQRFNEKFLFLPAVLFEPLIPWIYGFLHMLNYTERKRSRWN